MIHKVSEDIEIIPEGQCIEVLSNSKDIYIILDKEEFLATAKIGLEYFSKESS